VKATAANSTTLAIVKKDWNSKIFKHFSQVYNAEGYEAACKFLQQYTTADIKGYFSRRLQEMGTK
jgi:hypothetical protein